MNKLMNMMGYIEPNGKIDWFEVKFDVIVLGIVAIIVWFIFY